MGRRKAPHSRVKLEVLPEPNQPGLEDVPALGWRKVTLFLIRIVVGAVPVRSWFQLGVDKGRARGDGRVTGERRIIVGFKAARVTEENPEARRHGVGWERGVVGGGCLRGGGGIGVRALEDGKVGPWSVDSSPKSFGGTSSADYIAPLWGKKAEDEL